MREIIRSLAGRTSSSGASAFSEVARLHHPCSQPCAGNDHRISLELAQEFPAFAYTTASSKCAKEEKVSASAKNRSDEFFPTSCAASQKCGLVLFRPAPFRRLLLRSPLIRLRLRVRRTARPAVQRRTRRSPLSQRNSRIGPVNRSQLGDLRVDRAPRSLKPGVRTN